MPNKKKGEKLIAEESTSKTLAERLDYLEGLVKQVEARLSKLEVGLQVLKHVESRVGDCEAKSLEMGVK